MFEKRFTIEDDGDGLWSVIDAEKGDPAIVRQRTLVGLSQSEADDAAGILNMVAGIRIQKPKRPVELQPGLQPLLQPIR